MKSYDEIAKNIFKRRDEYIAKQKRKKRNIINTVTVMICCCIVLTIVFGLWKSGILSNNISIADSSQNNSNNSDNDFLEDNNPNDSSDDTSSKESNPNSLPNDTHSQDEYSSDSNSSSKQTTNDSDNSQGGLVTDNNPSNATDNTPSNSLPSTPPVAETNYFIDSLDKVNFYSAKKIISENSLLPIGTNYKSFSKPKTIFLSNNYAEHPIDRDKVFTATMVTYFTIVLNDEKGFLAQKLGGAGLIEVVVTQNNIDDMGQMITFKRYDRYYTCFINEESYDSDSNKVSRNFSSHQYIDGFNIVKNLEQENYKFTVNYEGSKVVGFESALFGGIPSKYSIDNITFVEDYCVVLFTKQNFTIDQLEVLFKNESEDGTL